MKVKIGNKIYDSFEQPIAILLSQDEIEAVNNLGARGRAIGSFPVGFDPLKAQLFLNEGWGNGNYKVRVDAEGVLGRIDLPDVPNLRLG